MSPVGNRGNPPTPPTNLRTAAASQGQVTQRSTSINPILERRRDIEPIHQATQRISESQAEQPTSDQQDYSEKNREVSEYRPEAADSTQVNQQDQQIQTAATENKPPEGTERKKATEVIIEAAEKLVAGPPARGGAVTGGATLQITVEPVPQAPTVEPIAPETMSCEASRGPFLAAINTLSSQWTTLATPEARGAAFGQAGADALNAVGVPRPGIAVVNMGANGQLDFRAWNLKLNRSLFDKPAANTDELAAEAETIYHEARHGEQWYRVCQMYASRDGLTAAEIQTRTGVPLNVAQAAHAAQAGASPTAADPAFVAWLESVYGAGAAARNTTLNSMSTEGDKLDQICTDWNTASTALDTLTTEWNTLKTANETAERDYNTKNTELGNRATAWNAKKAERDTFEPTFNEKSRLCAEAATVRDRAADVWREKNGLRDQTAEVWRTAKTAQDGAATTWHAKNDTKERAATEWRSRETAAARAEQQYQAAYQAWDQARTSNQAAAQIETLRSTACQKYDSHVAAHNAFKTADDTWKTADGEFTTADQAWQTAKTAFETADRNWNTANQNFETANTAWVAADRDHQAKVAEWRTAQDTLSRLNQELDTIFQGWQTCKTEVEGQRATWQTAFTTLEAKGREWQTKRAEKDQLATDYHAQKLIFDPLYAAYRALPEEVDAWREGELINREYKSRYGSGGGGGP